jgi:hypothetical protein
MHICLKKHGGQVAFCVQKKQLANRMRKLSKCAYPNCSKNVRRVV